MMEKKQTPDVAVLLATSTGGIKFIEAQLRSLKENTTPFTLHWIDDHSKDATPDRVRATAQELGIPLKEWRYPKPLMLPYVYFHLMECVEADIYMFCDQDDVWQPGKIDAYVKYLLQDDETPTLAFTDPLAFFDGDMDNLRRTFEWMEMKLPDSLEETRAFLTSPVMGQAMGSNRALRDLFLKSKDIAWKYAAAHSWWLYLVASGGGKAELLHDIPTTLYRQHENNCAKFWFRGPIWRLQHHTREVSSDQAEGFILASETFKKSEKLDRMLTVARMIATLKRRQSPAEVLRLWTKKAMWPNTRRALMLTACCLLSDFVPPRSYEVSGAKNKF